MRVRVEFLFADPANMTDIIVINDGLVASRVVVTFIQAQLLWMFIRHFRTFDNDCVKRI